MTRGKTASGRRVTRMVGSLGLRDQVALPPAGVALLPEMSKKAPYKHFHLSQLSAMSL